MQRLTLFGAVVIVVSCGSDATHMMSDAAEDVAVVLDAAADAIRDSAADAAEDAADAARDVGTDARDVGIADAQPDSGGDAGPAVEETVLEMPCAVTHTETRRFMSTSTETQYWTATFELDVDPSMSGAFRAVVCDPTFEPSCVDAPGVACIGSSPPRLRCSTAAFADIEGTTARVGCGQVVIGRDADGVETSRSDFRWGTARVIVRR